MCLCECVCMRDRERERKSEKERKRERERERESFLTGAARPSVPCVFVGVDANSSADLWK